MSCPLYEPLRKENWPDPTPVSSAAAWRTYDLLSPSSRRLKFPSDDRGGGGEEEEEEEEEEKEEKEVSALCCNDFKRGCLTVQIMSNVEPCSTYFIVVMKY